MNKALLEKWRNRTELKIFKEEFETEKIPSVIKRCPSCHSLSLEYDPKTGKILCTKCGFSENLPMIKQ